MYFRISKSLPGRLRLESSGFSLEEGFFIEDFFSNFPFVYQAKINVRTQSVLVDYDYKKEDALDILLSEFKKAIISPMENEERRREIELQNTVETKILKSVIMRYTGKLFFHYWLFKTVTSLKAIPYICRGLKKILQREMSVDILDGAAISIALLTDEYATASSTMFLLEMSHILEDFTTKKTKINLAKSLEINIDQALLVAEDGSESFVPASHIKKNQKVRITEGNIIAFDGFDSTEFIRDIACIEEHFHHPVGLSIVAYADGLGITHKEKHAEVQYIVAHGIETKLDGNKVRVGSYHYIFEDNEAIISEENHDHIKNLATTYSIIYMSYDNVVKGYVKLEDPARPEAIDMVKDLKARGVENIVMATGDSKHAAENISKLLGLSDFYHGVLPDTKAEIVKKYKEAGKVVMIGDGINDSLALSTADVSISLKDASDLARETADIILLKQDLADLGKLIDLSNEMAARIDRNFSKIIAINTSLLGLGLFGILMPQTTALIHNLSTLLIGLDASKKYKIN